MLVSINKVTLQWAQKVLGWVNIRMFVARLHHLGIQPTTQTNSAWPCLCGWVGEMSSGNSHDHC